MNVLWSVVVMLGVFVANGFAQGPPPAKVVVAPVHHEVVAETQSVLGVLYFDKISLVSSEVPGLVEAMRVKEGNYVKKGQPLVQLSTDFLENEIALRKAKISQLELQIIFAEKNFKRLDKVYAEQGVSEKVYDDGLYAFQDAKAAKTVAAQELAKLILQQEKSVVLAPFSGVVVEKNSEVGDWVQPGTQLMRLASTTDLYVRAPVAETLFRFVTVGDKVSVQLVALGSEVVGVVEEVLPTADAMTKNLFLKIKIPAQTQVAENMSAAVHVPAGPKRDLGIMPRAAVIKFQGKDFVYTVKDGKASILPVHIVSYLGEQVGVDDPYVVEGMGVVIEGNERLQPDQPVLVAGEK